MRSFLAGFDEFDVGLVKVDDREYVFLDHLFACEGFDAISVFDPEEYLV